LLIVSNTAGATTWDRDGKLASEVQKSTGVAVLAHRVKKPGCGDEIMAYFKAHPEAGVTSPSQIAVVGDRLATDMMLANQMGSYGIWVKDGVVPVREKSVVSIPNLLSKCRWLTLKCSSLGWRGRLGPCCWLVVMPPPNLSARLSEQLALRVPNLFP